MRDFSTVQRATEPSAPMRTSFVYTDTQSFAVLRDHVHRFIDPLSTLTVDAARHLIIEIGAGKIHSELYVADPVDLVVDNGLVFILGARGDVVVATRYCLAELARFTLDSTQTYRALTLSEESVTDTGNYRLFVASDTHVHTINVAAPNSLLAGLDLDTHSGVNVYDILAFLRVVCADTYRAQLKASMTAFDALTSQFPYPEGFLGEAIGIRSATATDRVVPAEIEGAAEVVRIFSREASCEFGRFSNTLTSHSTVLTPAGLAFDLGYGNTVEIQDVAPSPQGWCFLLLEPVQAQSISSTQALTGVMLHREYVYIDVDGVQTLTVTTTQIAASHRTLGTIARLSSAVMEIDHVYSNAATALPTASYLTAHVRVVNYLNTDVIVITQVEDLAKGSIYTMIPSVTYQSNDEIVWLPTVKNAVAGSVSDVIEFTPLVEGETDYVMTLHSVINDHHEGRFGSAEAVDFELVLERLDSVAYDADGSISILDETNIKTGGVGIPFTTDSLYRFRVPSNVKIAPTQVVKFVLNTLETVDLDLPSPYNYDGESVRNGASLNSLGVVDNGDVLSTRLELVQGSSAGRFTSPVLDCPFVDLSITLVDDQEIDSVPTVRKFTQTGVSEFVEFFALSDQARQEWLTDADQIQIRVSLTTVDLFTPTLGTTVSLQGTYAKPHFQLRWTLESALTESVVARPSLAGIHLLKGQAANLISAGRSSYRAEFDFRHKASKTLAPKLSAPANLLFQKVDLVNMLGFAPRMVDINGELQRLRFADVKIDGQLEHSQRVENLLYATRARRVVALKSLYSTFDDVSGFSLKQLSGSSEAIKSTLNTLFASYAHKKAALISLKTQLSTVVVRASTAVVADISQRQAKLSTEYYIDRSLSTAQVAALASNRYLRTFKLSRSSAAEPVARRYHKVNVVAQLNLRNLGESVVYDFSLAESKLRDKSLVVDAAQRIIHKSIAVYGSSVLNTTPQSRDIKAFIDRSRAALSARAIEYGVPVQSALSVSGRVENVDAVTSAERITYSTHATLNSSVLSRAVQLGASNVVELARKYEWWRLLGLKRSETLRLLFQQSHGAEAGNNPASLLRTRWEESLPSNMGRDQKSALDATVDFDLQSTLNVWVDGIHVDYVHYHTAETGVGSDLVSYRWSDSARRFERQRPVLAESLAARTSRSQARSTVDGVSAHAQRSVSAVTLLTWLLREKTLHAELDALALSYTSIASRTGLTGTELKRILSAETVATEISAVLSLSETATVSTGLQNTLSTYLYSREVMRQLDLSRRDSLPAHVKYKSHLAFAMSQLELGREVTLTPELIVEIGRLDTAGAARLVTRIVNRLESQDQNRAYIVDVLREALSSRTSMVDASIHQSSFSSAVSRILERLSTTAIFQSINLHALNSVEREAMTEYVREQLASRFKIGTVSTVKAVKFELSQVDTVRSNPVLAFAGVGMERIQAVVSYESRELHAATLVFGQQFKVPMSVLRLRARLKGIGIETLQVSVTADVRPSERFLRDWVMGSVETVRPTFAHRNFSVRTEGVSKTGLSEPRFAITSLSGQPFVRFELNEVPTEVVVRHATLDLMDLIDDDEARSSQRGANLGFTSRYRAYVSSLDDYEHSRTETFESDRIMRVADDSSDLNPILVKDIFLSSQDFVASAAVRDTFEALVDQTYRNLTHDGGFSTFETNVTLRDYFTQHAIRDTMYYQASSLYRPKTVTDLLNFRQLLDFVAFESDTDFATQVYRQQKYLSERPIDLENYRSSYGQAQPANWTALGGYSSWLTSMPLFKHDVIYWLADLAFKKHLGTKGGLGQTAFQELRNGLVWLEQLYHKFAPMLGQASPSATVDGASAIESIMKVVDESQASNLVLKDQPLSLSDAKGDQLTEFGIQSALETVLGLIEDESGLSIYRSNLSDDSYRFIQDVGRKVETGKYYNVGLDPIDLLDYIRDQALASRTELLENEFNSSETGWYSPRRALMEAIENGDYEVLLYKNDQGGWTYRERYPDDTLYDYYVFGFLKGG